MTTQAFSSDKSNKVSKYFSFQWKQGWPILVCLLIVFLLSFVLPAVLVNTSLNTYYNEITEEYVSESGTFMEHRNTEEEIISVFKEYLKVDCTVNVFISMIAALYIGMNSLKYVNSKVAVNFYHSLPIKRERHYITAVVIGFLDYIIAYLPCSLLAALIINLNGHVSLGSYAFAISLRYFAYSLLFFTFIYGIVMLAGSVSGTVFGKFLVACMIMFLPLCLYMTVIFMIGENNVYTNLEYYYSYDILKLVCPVLRVGEVYTSAMLSIESILIILGLGTVCMVLGLLIYKKRKSETAATPIYSSIVAAIIKYSAMFIITYITGIVFKSMVDSVVWEIIGFAIGMLLSFMVSNMILYKSSKAMFKGAYKMAYFSLAFAIIFVIFGGNIFKLDSKVPPSSFTTSIKVDYSGTEVEYCDKDDIEQIIKISRDIIKNKKIYYTDSDDSVNFEYEGINYSYWKREGYTYSIDVTSYGYFIIPNSKRFNNIKSNDEIVKYILSTPEYEASLDSKIKGEDIEYVSFDAGNNFQNDENIANGYIYYDIPNNVMKIIEDRLNDEKAGGIVVGVASVYYNNMDKNNNNIYEDINIYSDDYELINYFLKTDFKNGEEICDYIVSNIKYIFVNDEKNKSVQKITEPENIKKIIKSSVIRMYGQ